MQQVDIADIMTRQREFFAAGKPRQLAFRIQQLKKLKSAVKEMESELLEALRKDLRKPALEAYAGEIGFVYEEIDHALAHIHTWAQPRTVPTPLVLMPSSSRVHPQPKGTVLIIGPWNYPFQLVVAPLVAAMTAGNCAVLKPSEMTPETSRALARLVERTFSPEYCALVEGGVEKASALLAQRFDHIFFTGSTQVGRVVLRAAAEHLTPVTLELGGKSPAIVDDDVDIEVVARRIAWGKFYNAGQTCVAPDYLLVPRALKSDLLKALQRQVRAFYGENPRESPDFARIVNHRHFDRLAGLLGEGEIVTGGETDRNDLYIAPTIIGGVTMDAKIMEDEIFGPLLPVLVYDSLDQALALVRQRPDPLACYVFTRRQATEERVIQELPFGGGCINNALLHLSNPDLPFGGIGPSGMGHYHGLYGFATFSHHKAIMRSSMRFDIKLKYPPYGTKLKLLRRLIK